MLRKVPSTRFFSTFREKEDLANQAHTTYTAVLQAFQDSAAKARPGGKRIPAHTQASRAEIPLMKEMKIGPDLSILVKKNNSISGQI